MWPPQAPDLKNLSILSMVAVIMFVLYGQIDYSAKDYSAWDFVKYREIASAAPGLATNVSQPFAFRLLGPYLVGLIPLPDPLVFYAFTLVCSLGLIFLLYYFFQDMGLSASISLAAVALFTLNKFWFGFTIWDYFQINDVLSLLFIVILFWTMLSERWMVFGSIFVLAALTRETGILMIPVALTYLLEKKQFLAKWREVLFAFTPGLLIFFLIRIFVPSSGGETLLQAFLTYYAKILSPVSLFKLIVNSILPFSFIPLIFFEITVRFFRTRLYAFVFVLLTFLSTLFGSNDERLMAPAFIIVYLLLGIVVKELNGNKIFLALLIVGGFLTSFDYITARYPLPSLTVTWIVTLGSSLVVTVGAIVFRVMYSRQSRNLTVPDPSA